MTHKIHCALMAFLAACGGTNHLSGFPDSDGGGSSSGSSGGSSGLLGDGGGSSGSSGSSGGPGCAKEATFVYVVDVTGMLRRFDPPTVSFTPIAPLTCPGATFSMAVDRNAFAWVLMQTGQLVKVDTRNGNCTPTSFQPGQNQFAPTFGMGFSSDAAGSDKETLFVSSSTGATLATVNTQSLTLAKVGPYDQLNARVELTGTGDGRLFGAFEGSPYVVAQIDKTSAKIVSQAPQSAIKYPANGSNFAFAFWGGEFYLFVGPGQYTDVFKYKPSDGSTTKISTVQFEIVGAGVSTCAPTTIPK
jgi:hypothetical protein